MFVVTFASQKLTFDTLIRNVKTRGASLPSSLWTRFILLFTIGATIDLYLLLDVFSDLLLVQSIPEMIYECVDTPRLASVFRWICVVEREFFIDNLLFRIHLTIEMILVDRPFAMGGWIPFSR